MDIVQLTRGMNLQGFDCGDNSLNEWLALFAMQNQRRNLSRTFVAIDANEFKVLGFYTSLASKFQSELETKHRYPIPTLMIARLAVDSAHQGMGVGSMLLEHCFRQAVAISKSTGLAAVVVSALDENAAMFYTKVGFTALDSDPLTLLIPIKQLLHHVTE